jgi:hypothetical protein
VRVNNKHGLARSGREVRVDPMEGALVRAVLVVLNRRRAQRVWRGGVLGTASSDDVHGAPFGALRGTGWSPQPSGTSRDRERQRFARPVRLPQPMGAGGRRPPVGPRA